MPTVSEQCDHCFYRRMQELKEYKARNNNSFFHLSTKNKSLYNYCKKQRRKFRQNPEMYPWRWQYFEQLGFELNSPNVKRQIESTALSPYNLQFHWKSILETARRHSDVSEIQWLQFILAKYKKRNGFVKNNNYQSVTEFLLRFLRVGDINVNECRADAPKHDIRKVLYYIVKPKSGRDDNRNRGKKKLPLLIPAWRLLSITTVSAAGNKNMDMRSEPPRFCIDKGEGDPIICNTMLFKKGCFSKRFFDDAINDLPDWLVEYGKDGGSLIGCTEEELRKQMEQCAFLDHFPVSKLGTNTKDGLVDLAKSTQPGPRRVNLTTTVGKPHFQKRFNCNVFQGYSYTLSFVQAPFFGGRSFEKYPGIQQLGLKLWKTFREKYLSPISRLCPPNGAQVLLYPSKFKSRINKHKDMNPNMVINPLQNSQIVGSNVIVVTLFASQLVQWWEGNSAKNSKVIDSFVADHKSVYIQDPFDDINYYHSACFSNKVNAPNYTKEDLIRVAITYRWLGNRMNFLGEDYNGDRKNCQAMGSPMLEIKKRCRQESTQKAYKRRLAQGRKRKKKQKVE